jgi:two-component system LytT family response regulator
MQNLLKVLIIEDELPNAQRLGRMLLSLDESILIEGNIQSVRAAISWLQTHPLPHIIFMDIHLTDGMSFEIFQHVNITVPVIFLTAYDEYALKAFEVNAIDYLLKPIEKEKLQQSLEKAKRFLGTGFEANILQLIEKLQPELPVFRQRFLITYRDLLLPIMTEDIAYFYSENKITHLVTFKNENFPVETTLSTLENELEPTIFMRISRQHIIHINAIHKIYKLSNAQIGVELKPVFNEKLHLSREKSDALRKWLER